MRFLGDKSSFSCPDQPSKGAFFRQFRLNRRSASTKTGGEPAGGVSGGPLPGGAQQRSSFDGGRGYRQEKWRSLQRGRSGGRPASKRGRMRKRGPSGGGTLRRESPQEGQRPSLATGPAASARSQRPRAAHSGLMHCTVRPGRYCIASPQRPQSANPCGAAPPGRAPSWLQSPAGGSVLGHGPGTAREQHLCWRALCPESSLVSRRKHHKILW